MRFHGGKRRYVLVAGLALAALGAVAPAVAAQSAGSGAGWRAAEIFPVARGLDNPAVTHNPGGFTGLSCTSPGNCLAAGWYQRRAASPQWPFGQFRPTTATQSSGSWGSATRLFLPSDKVDPDGGAQITSVSCPTPDWCAAAGLIPTPRARDRYAFVVTRSGGQWNRPHLVQLPPNPQASPAISELDGISCTAPGSCVAVGWYISKAVNYVPIVEADRGGHWQRAIALPADLSPGPNFGRLSSVSCATPRWCLAVGTDDHGVGAGERETDLVTVFSRGRWQRPAPEPGSRGSSFIGANVLASVDCRAAGDCLAVGAGGYAVLEHGRWQRGGGAVPVPADGQPLDEPSLTAVSCTPSACLAGGTYVSEPGHDFPAFVVSYAGGKWLDPVRIRLPGNASDGDPSGPPQFQTVNAVSCTTTCTVVGIYTTKNDLEPNWAATGPG